MLKISWLKTKQRVSKIFDIKGSDYNPNIGLYDRAVLKTLGLYEKWILPENDMYGFPSNRKLISLREAKLREFKERKNLLHPYEGPKLLENADEEEKQRL